MKTTVERAPMTAGNEFRIPNFQDYTVLRTTVEENGEKVVMGFPWHNSLPPEHPAVKDAMKKTLDTAKESLLQYLELKRKKEIKKTPYEKLMDAIGRELKFMWSKICI